MLQRVKGKKLYEQVMDQITAQILNGNYKKGDMLPSEAELIKMTGVSRITVREALRALADAGVIATRKGKGSHILMSAEELLGSDADRSKRLEYRDTFLDSSKVRALIEPIAAAHFARTASEEQIAELEKAVNAPYADKRRSFDQFHTALIRSLDSKLLMDFFESLLVLERGKPDVYLIAPADQTNIAAELAQQHRKILDAIKDSNAEFAYFYMKEHCMYLIKVYEDYFDRFYFTGEGGKIYGQNL